MSIDGFLARGIANARLFADEPSVNSKFTDAQIIMLLETAWSLVYGEISRNSENPITVRQNISMVSGTSTYVLPPTMGEFLRIASVDTATGLPKWELCPRSRYNPMGPGFQIEGNVLRFLPNWQTTETLQLEYKPKATARLHEGAASAATATTITLATTPTAGTLDLRPNAYAGSVCRILGSGAAGAVGLELPISSYANTTRVATLVMAWPTTPTATITYEIAPLIWEPYDLAMAYYAARLMHTASGDAGRINIINTAYRDMMREIRLQAANVEGRMGKWFKYDTPQNTDIGMGTL